MEPEGHSTTTSLIAREHARMKLILDSLTDQFFAFDKNFRFAYLNLRAQEQMKTLGKDPESLIGKILWDEFPGVLNETAVRRVVSERIAIKEVLYCRPLEAWLENHMYPTPDGGFVTRQRDITDRKRKEETLRVSEERFRRYFDFGFIGMAITNPGKVCLAVNDEFCRILGYEREDLLHMTWEEITHPDDREADVAQFNRVIAGERDSYSLDKRWIRKDGCVIDTIMAAECVRRTDGSVDYVIGLVQNITERHNARLALEKAENFAREQPYLEREILSEQGFEEIIGQSQPLRAVLRQIEKVAPTDTTVLIQGETGTGKELFARAIHNLSKRREHTFVKVNCAAIPTGLLESELFGHEKGAFTGAIIQKLGRFELAHQGTIFLDEVGEIPLELQVKLLRVLQEHEFERLGSIRTQRVSIRVLAATNRDLAQMVAEKQFRSDLYYRLNVFPIYCPSLRQRDEDIPSLVRFFTKKYSDQLSKPIVSISEATMNTLSRYTWPGNIRELENVIERCVILSSGEMLECEGSLFEPCSDPQPQPQATTLEKVERDLILRTLEECRWIVSGASGAATQLGMKRTSLQYKMQKLGIARPIRI